MAELFEQKGEGTRHTLRVNSGRRTRLTDDERAALYEEFEELYSIGRSDIKIALETGVCDATVRRWRWRNNKADIRGRLPERRKK